MTQKRSTWQKSAVKDQLGKIPGFVSAQQLHQELLSAGQKIGLTTVYRALTELVSAEQADALTGNDGETRYRICGSDHHHHMICLSCGKTVEFELAGFELATQALADQHGFTGVSHSIEIFGTCADCGVAG
jgi:Fur family transcriptional regulator, ferric uptake regulator